MASLRYDLENRTEDFSKAVLGFCSREKLTVVTRPLISQLVRSATSIGANYAEANNASSRSDFRNKIFIAKKETAETKYWLNLLIEFTSDSETLVKLQVSCQQLLMIFQKIINSLREPQSIKS